MPTQLVLELNVDTVRLNTSACSDSIVEKKGVDGKDYLPTQINDNLLTHLDWVHKSTCTCNDDVK